LLLAAARLSAAPNVVSGPAMISAKAPFSMKSCLPFGRIATLQWNEKILDLPIEGAIEDDAEQFLMVLLKGV
jgi:hypothetical protein